MKSISVRVCGDHWLNPKEVEQQLQELAHDEPVMLDLHTEGASLTALGIKSMLDHYCQQNLRDPRSLHIVNWPNVVEPTNFTVYTNAEHISHFFWFSNRYRPKSVIPSKHIYQFGFFVGRRTLARCVMLWQHWKRHRDSTLFSIMNTYFKMPSDSDTGIQVDSIKDWLPDGSESEFLQWWSQDQIPSLDGHHVRDQYLDTCNTNLDLLAYYDQFDIEIVCESYTRGNSFFVTEKTIRPLCAGRPVLLFGPKNFLKNLQAMGFQTWSSIWDESYDNLEGPARWQAMQQTISEISNASHLAIWNQCQPICQHNHALVAELAQLRQPQ